MNDANQRWEEGRQRWRSDREVIRPSEYEMAEIPNETAKNFIETHHYSKDYPAARFRFGLHRHGTLVGVAVFSQPVNDRTVTKVFPVHPKEGVELGRLVLLDEVPGNGESFFVAETFRQLRQKAIVDKEGRELRGILGVVSFSDPMPRRTAVGEIILPGHVGTIYQSLNACYVGRGDARILRLLPDGRVFNHRSEQKVRKQEHGWKAGVEELLSYGAGPLWDDSKAWINHWLPRVTRPLPHRGNHKYVWALHRSMRGHLHSVGAYPKTKDQEAA
jgi:hypothetical protein